MIEASVSDGVLEAVDVGKNEVRIGVEGWDPTDESPFLARRLDRRLTGTVRRLEFAEAAVSIEEAEANQWSTFDPRAGPKELTHGPYVLKIEQSVIVYLAIDEPCVLEQSAPDGTISIEFSERAPVTIGLRSRIDRPRETVTVPGTLEGACTAIQWQAAGITTDTADKSFPNQRVHPPSIQFGEETAIPDAVRERAQISDISITVPDTLEALFVTAPLSFYLQADLALGEVDTVRLEAPTLDGPLRLGRTAPLEQDVAALLQRMFFLDCVVRNAGPYSVELRESKLIDELELDASALYDGSDAERLADYLRADYSAVADRLPDWHHSVVVEPDYASLPAIPHLLNRMSLVQCPSPVGVDRQSLVADSIQDAYAPSRRQWASGPTYDLITNRTRLGRLQGWLADGIPVDAFRATVSAFEHRFRYYERSSGPQRVVVVINDPAMLDERDAVERIYRSRSTELSIEVSVETSLDCADLRELLQSPVDFLHFIGHCEADGLRCRDGLVSAASLETTAVQTFFLNACGSFEQGLELVRQGSVAGAVTVADVLNREATRVGMTFARLAMHGYSISRALELASRQSLTNKFYNVVGDGTHRLTQGEDAFPAELMANQVSSSMYSLQFEFPQWNVPGSVAMPRLPSDAEYVLRGCGTRVELDREAFVDFLRTVQLPVIFENEFHWSTDLAKQVASGGRPGQSAVETN